MMHNSQHREVWSGAGLVFLSLALLTWLSNRHGTFFDDEIFTIRLLEQQNSVMGVIRAANSTDLHPPLAYALDFLLYQATGSWKAVQLVAGLINAAALAVFAAMAHRSLPRPAWLVLCGLLATCATTVMWGASLRWYGWFNPLFALALAAVLWGQLRPIGCFTLLAGLSTALFHIGYLAMIACPLLGLGWLWRYWREIDRKALHTCLAIALAALAMCLPQIDALIHVHLEYPIAAQFGSLPISLAQTGITMAIGNAVFPLGVLPIATALVFAAALLLTLRHLRAASPLASLWLIAGLGAAAMITSGLGYRPRNSAYLMIATLPLLAAALAALPRRARMAALALTALFQLQGLYNVAFHQGTAKRSFNTPYGKIIAAIDQMKRDCPHIALIHDDDVMGYLTRGHLAQPNGPPQALKKDDCIVLQSGAAAEPSATFTSALPAWLAKIRQMPVTLESEQKFAPEPQVAAAARLLGKTVDGHAATLRKYRVRTPITIPGTAE